MQRIALIFIIFTLLFTSFLRAEEISLTLDEAIVIALRDNRDILLKAEEVKKAKAEIAEAKAGLWPTINFTSSWTDTRGYYAKDLLQTSAQATLKQYLYQGGKTINSIEQNKYKLEVSGALLDKTKLELVLNVKKAFYTLLLAKEFAGLNKGIVDNTKGHLDYIKERYQYGQASESEVLNIKASLSNVWQVYEASLNQAQAAQVLLNNLLYLNEDTKIRPDTPLTYAPVELAYDAAFLEAMKNRPEIRQYVAQAEADKNAIEIAKADNRPNIYASWDYYSRSHASATTSKNWNDYNIIGNIIGLTFSWPIFDGWLTQAKVEQAIVDLKETRLTREKMIQDIARELKTAYLDLKNAIVKIKTAESDTALYKDNLEATETKYKGGIASVLDFDDSRIKYDVSEFNKNEAIYDYIIAKASFDKATGGI